MFYIYVDGQLLNRPLEETLIAFSPILKMEMGKSGSLEFSLPPSNIYYNSIRKLKTIVTVEMDDVEIFRGRVLSYTRNINNVKKFYVEGDLAYLVDSVQKPEKYIGTTHALFRKIIAAHNAQVDSTKRFVVGNINIENREIMIRGQSDETEDQETGEFDYQQIAINSTTSDWSTSYDYIVSCLIEYCGGYLRTRRVGSTVYIDLLTDYGNTAVQNIEFGSNLLDLTEEVTAEEVFTVLIPIGDDNLTIESVNGGSNTLVDEEGVALYGPIVKTHVFDNVFEASTLLENGQRFMANHENTPITFTIRAVDMHLLDPDIQEIYVGDSVLVKSAPHGLASSFICTRIEYDLENPANNTYTFGNPRQTLTQRYREDKRKEEDSGHTGGSGGAGSAGSAADDKAQENLDKFYDAWINLDPEHGHIDLGAIYKELKEGKDVLKQQVGIDLDAPTGHINIYALREDLRALDGRVINNSAAIELWANDLKAQIDAHVGWSEEFEKETKAWHAQLVLEANKNGEAIAALKTTHENQIAELELKSTELKASALMKADYNANRTADLSLISKANESIATLSTTHGNRLSSLESKTTAFESSMILKADYNANRTADLSLISKANESIATLSTTQGERLSSLESKTTAFESSMILKADYNANRTADLSLISKVNESIATLSATHGDRLSSLESRVTASEASMILKADYNKNRTADLSLISKANESIATLSTTHGNRLSSLESRVTETEASMILKADYNKNRTADLSLISKANESIATLSTTHGNRLSSLESKTTAFESSMILKADYNANRTADLSLISKADESIATLSTTHGNRLSSLESKTTAFEASMILKADYNANRTADLSLISKANESIATLSTTHGNRLSSLESRVTETEASMVLKADYNNKIASIEINASSLGTKIAANANAIELKASKTSLNSAVTTINERIKIVEDDISGIDELIANKISAADIDVSKLESKTISVSGLIANRLYAHEFVSAPRLSMGGALVATQNWVNELVDGLITASWVDEQGFATTSWVSGKNYWGSSPETGKYWLYANGTGKLVALGNHGHDYAAKDHTHSWDSITGKPSSFTPQSHTHSFSASTSLAWGHTHSTGASFKAGSNTMGVVNYKAKTIEISGTTGRN